MVLENHKLKLSEIDIKMFKEWVDNNSYIFHMKKLFVGPELANV